MQDLVGSVRRSLNFATTRDDTAAAGGGLGGWVERVGANIRRSRIGLFYPTRPNVHALPAARADDVSSPNARPAREDEAPAIRWRKGELIGCGAFGRVYMGMNLDSGELLAVKQVSIAANSASKEKTQAHIRELEEEVKLLKNLSHPNIVRYLGTAREEESLNILLEFVPGGSISSLLGKFGSFPESVIRMYTKQLLLGLEYLHKNGIMHRDIKGANILVDNKGCIKLADFGASKKVVELATINGAKSMKGTPYWMAPEVILQTGHNFSADIWSVGCTVIEMATGKPPWSQQYQEVAALFHIGTTKSHPPIPEHLSAEAKDFLLKCLQKEPDLRPSASDLLQHPFVTGDYREPLPLSRTSTMGNSGNVVATTMDLNKSMNYTGAGSFWKPSNCDDDMCQLDDKDFMIGEPLDSLSPSGDLNKSFNPMCEPTDDWPCKFDESPGMNSTSIHLSCQKFDNGGGSPGGSGMAKNDFAFPSGSFAAEDDDEVTESKIRAFLDEKALDLKKLQTPLYEFYNSLNVASCSSAVRNVHGDIVTNMPNLPPKSKSPSRLPSRRLSAAVDATNNTSPGSNNKCMPNADDMNDRVLQEIQPHVVLDAQQENVGSSGSFSERQRRWKEELDEEIQRTREIMRQAGIGGKTSSPKDRVLSRQRSRFADAGK